MSPLLIVLLIVVVVSGLVLLGMLSSETTPPEKPHSNIHPPQRQRSITVQANHAFAISAPVQLEIKKAIYQLEFWSRQYNLNLWSSSQHRDNWEHDLGVMRMKNDLRSLQLELLDNRQKVLHEFRITFAHGASQSKVVDSANGVEVLVLKPKDRARIVGHRLTVRHITGMESYRHLLQLNWSSVQKLQRHSYQRYESEHAKRITGGRLQGQFHVDQQSRHLLRITNAGARGFAFAESIEDRDMQGIFCHEKFAPANFVFQPGLKVWAVVVQTPRGLQARSIEAAA